MNLATWSYKIQILDIEETLPSFILMGLETFKDLLLGELAFP